MPYRFLYPAILAFCAIGVFSLNNSVLDIYLMALFGLLGYVFGELDCEPAPMLLAFILGPLMEEYLRRARLMSRGDPMVFLRQPISATLLVTALLAMHLVFIPAFLQNQGGSPRRGVRSGRPPYGNRQRYRWGRLAEPSESPGCPGRRVR